MRIGKIIFELFQVTYICNLESDEVDSGYYGPQMTSDEVDSE